MPICSLERRPEPEITIRQSLVDTPGGHVTVEFSWSQPHGAIAWLAILGWGWES